MAKTVIVSLKHARALGYCAKGMRRWFEGREYSWAEFVQHGVPAEWLRSTGDAMAIRVAEEAERWAEEKEEEDNR